MSLMKRKSEEVEGYRENKHGSYLKEENKKKDGRRNERVKREKKIRGRGEGGRERRI